MCWKSIEGYESLYEINQKGEVRNYKNKRLLKPYLNEKGYQTVTLSKEGKTKKKKVHRLVALTFLNNPDMLPDVNHKDYDRKNNHVSNLEWMGRKENVNYSSSNGNFVTAGPTKASVTGTRGVSWSKEKNMWRVRIGINYKRKHIGYFKDFDEAVTARKKAENNLIKGEYK